MEKWWKNRGNCGKMVEMVENDGTDGGNGLGMPGLPLMWKSRKSHGFPFGPESRSMKACPHLCWFTGVSMGKKNMGIVGHLELLMIFA